MKKQILNCAVFVFAGLVLSGPTLLVAQAPQTIPYQAVARDASGNLLVNTSICVQYRVYNAATGGTLLYEEHQTATTNKLGLFTASVGQGTPDAGGTYSSISSISWGSATPYLEIGLDVTGACSGGTSYTTMGARSQMQSVPFALYAASAATAASSAGPAGGDLTGTYPNPSLAAAGTAGTYTKVTTDSKGRVISGSALSATDVPTGNLTESTSDVLNITNGTNAVVGTGTAIQIKKATASQDGYLSSTDWSTFNNKLTTASVTAPLSGAGTTASPILVAANSASSAGVVSAGSGNNNKVWGTDASGNPGWISGNTNVTGAALTETNDANVTLTLGGSPLTALLNSTSITAGWAGQLAVSRGGTGAATLTGYVYGNGTGAMTASTTIPYSALTGTPTIPTATNYIVNSTSTQTGANFAIDGAGKVGTAFTAGTNITAGGSVAAGTTVSAGAYAVLGTNTAAGYYQDANNGAYRSIVAVGNTNGYYFQNYGGATTSMYVGLDGTYKGRVGIGNAAPGYALDVTGTANAAAFALNAGVTISPITATANGYSYGSLDISGSNNGYAGVNFTDEKVVLMMNSAYQGVYNSAAQGSTWAADTWQWEFYNGVLTAGTVPLSQLTVGGTAAQYITGTGSLATFPSYQTPITLTTTTASAATLSSGTLNIPSHGRQLFTASGTWTNPGGVTQVWISGAGGGGGGGRSTNTSGAAGGGGGAACVAIAVTVSGNVAVTVGTGGAGTTSTSVTPAAGTASSFGTYVTLGGGSAPTNNNNQGQGGAPGTMTLGTGATAPSGVTIGTAIVYGGAYGGAGGTQGAGSGGGTMFGAGGGGGINSGTGAYGGFNGGLYGGGGGGGTSTGGTYGSGGSGANGFILVEW